MKTAADRTVSLGHLQLARLILSIHSPGKPQEPADNGAVANAIRVADLMIDQSEKFHAIGRNCYLAMQAVDLIGPGGREWAQLSDWDHFKWAIVAQIASLSFACLEEQTSVKT